MFVSVYSMWWVYHCMKKIPPTSVGQPYNVVKIITTIECSTLTLLNLNGRFFMLVKYK
jgi:hypothetical protein